MNYKKTPCLLLVTASLCSCNSYVNVTFDKEYSNILNDIKTKYGVNEVIEVVTPSFENDENIVLKVNNNIITTESNDKYAVYKIPSSGSDITISIEANGSTDFPVLNEVVENENNFDFSNVVEVQAAHLAQYSPNFIGCYNISQDKNDIDLVLSKLYAPVYEGFEPVVGAGTNIIYKLVDGNGNEFDMYFSDNIYLNKYKVQTKFENLSYILETVNSFFFTSVESAKFLDLNGNDTAKSIALEEIRFKETDQVFENEPLFKCSQYITGFGEMYVYNEDQFAIHTDKEEKLYYKTIKPYFSVLFNN